MVSAIPAVTAAPERAPHYLTVNGGVRLETTPVYDLYWRSAVERQRIYVKRLAGRPAPWTDDPVLGNYRFCNVYRASDRVSQMCIRIGDAQRGRASADEVFFRIMLFKIFNSIRTWDRLCRELGTLPSFLSFHPDGYAEILDGIAARGAIYNSAYVMPNPPFGHRRKHRNHMHLLQSMMDDGAPQKALSTQNLGELFDLMLSYPSHGRFLAFQYAIDLNYSLTMHDEREFVVAGPGALSGISKCFVNHKDASAEDVIHAMQRAQHDEFERLGMRFNQLGGSRELMPIDIQNWLCETNKIARVVFPDVKGCDGRSRIKQVYRRSLDELLQPLYPPSWKVSEAALRRQLAFEEFMGGK